MGGDGVLGGRCTDGHCDAFAHGRGADRNGVQAVSEGVGVFAFTGRCNGICFKLQVSTMDDCLKSQCLPGVYTKML